MCDLNMGKLLSPKTQLIDMPLEMGMLKPGRLNPIPGKLGHGAPFEQFSGTYKGKDVLGQTGISPGAQEPQTFGSLYAPDTTPLRFPKPGFGANALPGQPGVGAVQPGQQAVGVSTPASLAQLFAAEPGSNNVTVLK